MPRMFDLIKARQGFQLQETALTCCNPLSQLLRTT